jgi:hypothetical protein
MFVVTRWSEKMGLKEDLLATYISHQRMFAFVQYPLLSQVKGLLTLDGQVECSVKQMGTLPLHC